jgi:flagellar hook-length control protein FliK
MSGAAGALAPLASANRRSGIMSALTVSSATAPAAVPAPQGSQGEAATGFQSLLAALSGPGGKSKSAEIPARPASKVDKDVEAPAMAGFLVAPAPVQALVVAPETVAVTVTDSGSGTPDGFSGTAPADDSLPRPTTASAADGGLADAEAVAAPIEPKPTGPNPASPVAARPGSASELGGARPLDKAATATPQTLPPLPEAATSDASDVAEVATQTRVPAPPTPPPAATTPIALAPLAAQTTPLRPLAERTSRPVEAGEATAGDAQPADGAARPAASIAAARPADQPARPVEPAAALIPRDTGSDETEDADPALAPTSEAVEARTQTAAATRDPVVSTLSRATVEATAQIAAQILRRLEGRSTRFEMALTPDELGRVDVKLDIDSEGRLNARLAFDNPAAATDLRGRADELRRQLEDAGFHLADDAFEFADRDSGSSAFDRGQDSRPDPSRAFAAASRLNAEIDVAQPPRWMALTHSPAGVDMKV